MKSVNKAASFGIRKLAGFLKYSRYPLYGKEVDVDTIFYSYHKDNQLNDLNGGLNVTKRLEMSKIRPA